MNQNYIKYKGKKIIPYISEEKIQQRVSKLAQEITKEIAGKNYLILGILNGAFMFLSDLVRQFNFSDFSIDFIKMASYQGTQSTGQVQELIGLKQSVRGRNVLVVDDILETGQTLFKISEILKTMGAEQIKFCVCAHKPGKLQVDIRIDHIAFQIDDVFIIGYGMDWNEQFRGLRELYYAIDDE